MERTDKKLTDAEVKKALKCCSTYHDVRSCKNCPLDGKCEPNLLEQYALDLINRREGEKEKNENIIRIADKTIATLNAENESLKAEVERLNNNISAAATTLSNCARATRHEAYKEFVERLKEKLEYFCLEKENFVSEEQIDNLLNELVGE